ncbi:MAG TPA: hypothetical protein VLZ75_00070 [Chitinophagales bacterium]|nr:hypothetical protein [Chitinophagales bacterium]
MKQVTLEIPEKKFEFFMELIENLGFVKTNVLDIIPEEHKKIVRNRITESDLNPEKILDWNDIKNDFNLD